MVLRNNCKSVAVLPLASHHFTRPIVASCPCGYRSGPAKAMLEILDHVSRRWVAKRPPALVAV
jgi:hypothetical protein